MSLTVGELLSELGDLPLDTPVMIYCNDEYYHWATMLYLHDGDIQTYHNKLYRGPMLIVSDEGCV